MKNNTTELLSVIVKAMSKEGIELTNVELYEQAVELNNEVKVRISNGGYLINRVNERDVISCALQKSMVNKVLGLLTKDEWLPGDDIELQGEWFTLVVEEDNHYTVSNNEYCFYRLLDNNYKLSKQMTLEDLKCCYTNVSLEQGRLK